MLVAVALLSNAVILPVALVVLNVKLSKEDDAPVVAVRVVVTGFMTVWVAVSVLCARRIGAKLAQRMRVLRMPVDIVLGLARNYCRD